LHFHINSHIELLPLRSHNYIEIFVIVWRVWRKIKENHPSSLIGKGTYKYITWHPVALCTHTRWHICVFCLFFAKILTLFMFLKYISLNQFKFLHFDFLLTFFRMFGIYIYIYIYTQSTSFLYTHLYLSKRFHFTTNMTTCSCTYSILRASAYCLWKHPSGALTFDVRFTSTVFTASDMGV
jgi:hypothetical protein